MGAADAAPGHEEAFDARRKQRPVADVVGTGRLRMPFGLSATRRVVDVDEEPGVVDDGVGVVAPLLHVGVRHGAVADDAARFAHAGRGGAGFHAAPLIPRDVPAEERDAPVDLGAQFGVGPAERGGVERVDAVELRRVHAALAGMKGAVEADDRDVLRELARRVHALAEFAVFFAGREFHGIRTAPGRDGPRFVHAVDVELQRHRLGRAVGVASDAEPGAGRRGDAPVARGVHHGPGADLPKPLRRVHDGAGNAGALHDGVHDRGA